MLGPTRVIRCFSCEVHRIHDVKGWKHYCAHGISPEEAEKHDVPGRFIGADDLTPKWCPHMDKVRDSE